MTKPLKPHTRLRVIVNGIELYGTKKSFYATFGDYNIKLAYDEVIKRIETERVDGAGIGHNGISIQVNVLN